MTIDEKKLELRAKWRANQTGTPLTAEQHQELKNAWVESEKIDGLFGDPVVALIAISHGFSYEACERIVAKVPSLGVQQ